MKKNKRNGLSGIYIFEKFEGEDKEQPTTIEDCTETTRNKWLDSLDKDGLKRTVNILCETINNINKALNMLSDNML